MAKKIEEKAEVETEEKETPQPFIPLTGRVILYLSDSDSDPIYNGKEFIGIHAHPLLVEAPRWFNLLDQVAEIIPFFQDQYDGTIRVTMVAKWECHKDLREPIDFTESHIFSRESNKGMVAVLHQKFIIPLCEKAERAAASAEVMVAQNKEAASSTL
jgi:hypothetical protein